MYGSGRLRWNELVEPVVELAKGWRVSRELARRFRIYGSEFEVVVERRRLRRYGCVGLLADM
jgi:gamma-glutamyltranspeptidase